MTFWNTTCYKVFILQTSTERLHLYHYHTITYWNATRRDSSYPAYTYEKTPSLSFLCSGTIFSQGFSTRGLTLIASRDDDEFAAVSGTYLSPQRSAIFIYIATLLQGFTQTWSGGMMMRLVGWCFGFSFTILFLFIHALIFSTFS